jgi:hypothetical protein
MANIVKKEVKTYKVYAYCEKYCRDCGNSEVFLQAYPSTEYEGGIKHFKE